jgi:preprotein translocase subunit SecE|tara:strand:+ start:956 stop:1153 length:198 start_codon:yes stop_codon:yes gene_type:complete
MAGIKTYIEDSVDELKNKVSWPTWSELQSSAIVVLVAAFIIAGVIYLMDSAFGNIMKVIYNNIFN